MYIPTYLGISCTKNILRVSRFEIIHTPGTPNPFPNHFWYGKSSSQVLSTRETTESGAHPCGYCIVVRHRMAFEDESVLNLNRRDIRTAKTPCEKYGQDHDRNHYLPFLALCLNSFLYKRFKRNVYQLLVRRRGMGVITRNRPRQALPSLRTQITRLNGCEKNTLTDYICDCCPSGRKKYTCLVLFKVFTWVKTYATATSTCCYRKIIDYYLYDVSMMHCTLLYH